MFRRTLLTGTVLIGAGTAASIAIAQSANPAKIRAALLPDENASTIIQNAQPLKKHLEEVLKKEVELVVTTDYSSMIEAMRFGRIEIAYFGPLSYILAKAKAPGIEPFAVGISKGSPTYKSVLIALTSGPVKAIADIKGKTMGYGDNASTSSHLIPRAYLARNGLISDRDYKPVFLGTHDAVARAVQAGQVQAGGLSQDIFNSLVARGTVDGAKITVLAESDPIPNYPMVMQGGLSPDLKAAIRKAFLEMKDKEILRSFRAEGFAATDDKAYDILRETARVLDLDLSKLKG